MLAPLLPKNRRLLHAVLLGFALLGAPLNAEAAAGPAAEAATAELQVLTLKKKNKNANGNKK